ncbi:MAG TPA: cell division protein ZipA C-terminal FtsZ-binding domain-containing protein [Steroidobacteraceae bacterium]
MPQLRWTLLCLGVVFIVLLAWIERRRQRRQGFTDSPSVDKDLAHGPGPDSTVSAAFREPVLTLPEIRAARESPTPTQDLPVVEIEDDSLNARRVEVGEPLRDPPTLSLPVVDSGPEIARRRADPVVSDFDSVQLPRTDDLQIPQLDTPASKVATPAPKKAPHAGGGDSEERAFNDAVFGETAADPDEPHTRTDVLSKSGPTFQAQSEPPSRTQFLGGAAVPSAPAAAAPVAPVAPAAPRFTPADVAPIADPIVDWPPDDQRKVVALRLAATPPDRFAGRALRLALASEGFVLGKFQIFHKPDESGRAVLSAANLSKPGTFDIGTMDSQRYAGLSLFTVLPGPRPPLKAFEDLLATARNLNERLNGALQDERGGPLTPTRITSLRDALAGSETPS